MLAIEECLRKRTALKPLEEALIIGVDARAHPWLALAAVLCMLIASSVGEAERKCTFVGNCTHG